MAFSLKFYRQEELKTRTFEYSAQAAVAREAAPQGLFSTIADGLDLDRVIREINLDDDFFRRLVATISVGGDFETAGIDTVAVNLEYPAERSEDQPPLHTDGFVFRPGELTPRTFTTWLDESRNLDYRYRMEIHFKPDAPWIGNEEHVRSDWKVTGARQLTLNPMDEVDLLDVSIQLGDMDTGEVSQVQLELAYEDPASDFQATKSFLIRPGDAPKRWQLRLGNESPQTYRYRATFFLPNNLRYETQWQASSDTTLIVNEPFKDTLKVRLVPLLDADSLLEAVVDLTYSEAETGYTRRLQEIFTGGERLTSKPLSIPTLAENPEQYRFESTVIRNDGSVFESGEQMRDSSAAVVTDGEGMTHRIRVRLPGEGAGIGNLAALKVDLVGPGSDPDREACLFTPSQLGEKTVSLVQPDEGGGFEYRYTITGYTFQGEPIAGESSVTGDRTLIVRIPGG